jgi:hypothetical protein
MSITISDEKLFFLYIPIPKSATESEIEFFLKTNAKSLARQFSLFMEHYEPPELGDITPGSDESTPPTSSETHH